MQTQWIGSWMSDELPANGVVAWGIGIPTSFRERKPIFGWRKVCGLSNQMSDKILLIN